MSERTSDSKDTELVTVAELVKSALDATLTAIAGYDAILWRIRAGYLAVLYGSLGLILGKTSSPDLQALAANLPKAVAAITLISCFSLAAFLIDYGYLRKKLKVVVARDELVGYLLGKEGSDRAGKLRFLLRISGEAEVAAKDLFPIAHSEYLRQRNWNLRWITLWLYGTAPVVSILLYLVAWSWKTS
jgi:hypothetical protein